jgi:hypothetical protein
VLILASLADGPKHGDALIKNVQNVVATALGRARCPRHSPAFSSAA